MLTRVLALGALSLLAGRPASAQEPPAAAEPSARDFGARFVERWNARDAAGLAALFEPQDGAVRLSAGATVRGRENIAEWFRRHAESAAPKLAEAREAFPGSPLTATLHLVPAGAAADAEGRHVPDWELMLLRGADGWRALRLRQIAPLPAGAVTVVAVGGTIKEPRKLKNVPPAYPDDAKKARIAGPVILECTISPEGHVTAVEVLTGHPMLAPSATEAVKQWVYTPTLLNDVPVPVIMTVTVNFRLH